MTKCETYASELVALKANRAPFLADFEAKKITAQARLDNFATSQGQYRCGELVITYGVADSYKNGLYLAPGQCQGKGISGDPCSQSGCEDTIKLDVNPSLLNMQNAWSKYNTNEANILAKEAQYQNDAECKTITLNEAEQDVIDQARNRQIRNGIIWFLVVSAVIGVLIWLDKKYFHIVLK